MMEDFSISSDSGAEPYLTLGTVNAAHAVEPKLTAGNTEYDPATAVHYIRYNVSKADKVFGGFKYISIQESTRDIIADFKQRKWLD